MKRHLHRLLVWLGIEFADEPVDAGAGVDASWCNHLWEETHVCDLPNGHMGDVHRCACGSLALTDRGADRLARLLRLPAEYDDCTWPPDTPCPRHDRRDTWPTGRDCRGYCTNCSASPAEWHAESCSHYDPATVAADDALMRRLDLPR